MANTSFDSNWDCRSWRSDHGNYGINLDICDRKGSEDVFDWSKM
jgi:hypothetical protein